MFSRFTNLTKTRTLFNPEFQQATRFSVQVLDGLRTIVVQLHVEPVPKPIETTLPLVPIQVVAQRRTHELLRMLPDAHQLPEEARVHHLPVDALGIAWHDARIPHLVEETPGIE